MPGYARWRERPDGPRVTGGLDAGIAGVNEDWKESTGFLAIRFGPTLIAHPQVEASEKRFIGCRLILVRHGGKGSPLVECGHRHSRLRERPLA